MATGHGGPGREPSVNRLAGALFAACLAPRIAALVLFPQPPPNFYWRIADSLLATGTFALDGAPTGGYEPLYPLFLVAARWATGDRFALVMLIQAMVAASAGVLLFLLADRLAGRRAAIVTSACYAVYPYYVRQSVAPLEVTLSTVLLIGAAWQYSRMQGAGGAVRLGLWLGLLVLLRAMFAPIWAAAALILVVRREWRQAVAVALVPLAMLSPWAAWSFALERPLVPSRVGENLFVSTCDPADQVVPRYDVDLIVHYAYAAVDADRLAAELPEGQGEGAVDAALRRAAVACAYARPIKTIGMKLRNLAYVFSPELMPVHARNPGPLAIVENGRVTFVGAEGRGLAERGPHFVAHLAITIGAAAGLWIRRRRLKDDVLVLVMLANTAVVYSVFFPTTRLVAPTSFVLMFYAGACFRATTAAAPRQR